MTCRASAFAQPLLVALRPDATSSRHFSVQRDHVHTIVEAVDNATLTRGMRSLTVRIAMRLNRALARSRGRVWDDRYYRRDLKTPRIVRNAIVYVLANFKKHERITHGRPLVDACERAAERERRLRRNVLERGASHGRARSGGVDGGVGRVA